MKIILKIILVSLFLVYSCRKLPHERIIAVTTNTVEISSTTITAKGTIIDIGEDGITDHGFCWSDIATPTLENNFISLNNKETAGDFQSTLHNLQANINYYVRAFAADNNQTIYGEIRTFTASATGITITTNKPIIESVSTATVSGTLSNIGSLKVLSFGHCWSANKFPVISDTHSDYGVTTVDTIFTSSLTALKVARKYYVRAYAKLDDNTVLYSQTDSISIPDLIVTTDTFTIISATSATLKGTIVELGIPAVTDYGFCWSTVTSNPDYNSNKFSLGVATAEGPYFTTFADLTAGTTYYFRAYATDGVHVKYGRVIKLLFN